ncbi:MAG: esterase-like activity of phytase family protein [Allosphingosinicella sp.]
MRFLLGLLFLVLLATFTPPGRQDPPPRTATASLRFAPIPLDRSDPRQDRLGGLVYLGGWALIADNPLFGGVSALHVEGGEATAFSDSGSILRFPLPPVSGPATVRIAPLPDGPGTGERKIDRDVEAAVLRGRLAWIAFERGNAVWRYDRNGWRAKGAAAPEAMERWSGNRGAEAMVRLPDARFLVFAEGRKRESAAVLFHGDPSVPGTRTERLRYRPPRGYRVTDAALLPDGRILLLNRRFQLLDGVSAKLVVLRPARWREGDVLRGEEVAHLRAPMSVDNMEALAVAEEGGRTILWIASDDNFNPLQRTLLMKFALAEGA